MFFISTSAFVGDISFEVEVDVAPEFPPAGLLPGVSDEESLDMASQVELSVVVSGCRKSVVMAGGKRKARAGN
jgi:hypothetical protein